MDLKAIRGSARPRQTSLNKCSASTSNIRREKKNISCSVVQKKQVNYSKYSKCTENKNIEKKAKKQNVNYLLNFQFSPRDKSEKQVLPTNRKKANVHRESSLKQGYLYANCQFLVKNQEYYQQSLTDVDINIQWDLIEQVELPVIEFMNCPICLCPPVACKITKCGHLFCWACILHCLSFKEKKWSHCPICFDLISLNDLKSVVEKPIQDFRQSDLITFRLMRRSRNSLQVYTIEQSDSQEVFSRIKLANYDQLMSIVNREEQELIHELSAPCLEKTEEPFLLDALHRLKERKREIIENVSTCHTIPNDTAPCSSSDTNFVYFYQAMNGHYMFLHSINCKMLEMMYGELSSCPEFVEGKILQREDYKVNESLRRRFKHIQHLPLQCEIGILEIQIFRPPLSKFVISVFKENLLSRKLKRNQQEKRENIQVKKSNQKHNHNEMYEEISESFSNLNLDSTEHFPICSEAVLEESSNASSSKPSFAEVISLKNANLSQNSIEISNDASHIEATNDASSSASNIEYPAFHKKSGNFNKGKKGFTRYSFGLSIQK